MSDLRVNRVRSLSGGTVEFVDGVSGNATGLRFAPKIIQYSPLALATDVNPTTSQFQFTFDQPIKFHGTGTIQIIKSSDSSVYESFAITNGGTAGVGVTIAANVLQLTTSAGDFEFLTSYHVAFSSAGIANTYNDYLVANDGYTFRTSPTSFELQGGDYEFVAAGTDSPTGYYKYHIFTNPGVLTATSPSSTATDLQVMMIGGGGAGGSGVNWPSVSVTNSLLNRSTGGGGAGGYLTFTGPTLNISAGTWDVNIGTGGTSIKWTESQSSIWPFGFRNGTPSTLSKDGATITAYGGGYGGNWTTNNNPTSELTGLGFPSENDWDWGGPGGSGGGGGGHNTTVPNWTPGGNNVSSQGNPGAGQINTRYQPNGNEIPQGEYYSLGGGGGGAGGAGNGGVRYDQVDPARPSYYGRHGAGGVGIANTYFPSSILAPRLSGVDPSVWSRMGPTGDYYAGGGAGGGSRSPDRPWYAAGNVGGYGGGGRSNGPWIDGATPTSSTSPVMTVPTWSQEGAPLLGGGGGGGQAHTSPASATDQNDFANATDNRGGSGGPGCFMARYVHPGS